MVFLWLLRGTFKVKASSCRSALLIKDPCVCSDERNRDQTGASGLEMGGERVINWRHLGELKSKQSEQKSKQFHLGMAGLGVNGCGWARKGEAGDAAASSP